jgi:cellulose biosynthesis protein BcsQ
MKWLSNPTRFLFFTGKGGVGKTSISAAVAIRLADAGIYIPKSGNKLKMVLTIAAFTHHPEET